MDRLSFVLVDNWRTDSAGNQRCRLSAVRRHGADARPCGVQARRLLGAKRPGERVLNKKRGGV